MEYIIKDTLEDKVYKINVESEVELFSKLLKLLNKDDFKDLNEWFEEREIEFINISNVQEL